MVQAIFPVAPYFFQKFLPVQLRSAQIRIPGIKSDFRSDDSFLIYTGSFPTIMVVGNPSYRLMAFLNRYTSTNGFLDKKIKTGSCSILTKVCSND